MLIWDEFLRHFRLCDEEDSGLSDEEQKRKRPKNSPKHTRKRIHQAKKNFLEKFKTVSKNGFLIMKTMDFVFGSSQHWVGNFVQNTANEIGFVLYDTFILVSRVRRKSINSEPLPYQSWKWQKNTIYSGLSFLTILGLAAIKSPNGNNDCQSKSYPRK